ncbi:hypothetical protein ACFLXO_08850 [Chloroflexota bacterium]
MVPVFIFVGLILVSIGVLIFFKTKWSRAAGAAARGRSEQIEDERIERERIKEERNKG